MTVLYISVYIQIYIQIYIYRCIYTDIYTWGISVSKLQWLENTSVPHIIVPFRVDVSATIIKIVNLGDIYLPQITMSSFRISFVSILILSLSDIVVPLVEHSLPASERYFFLSDSRWLIWDIFLPPASTYLTCGSIITSQNKTNWDHS